MNNRNTTINLCLFLMENGINPFKCDNCNGDLTSEEWILNDGIFMCYRCIKQ